ncbi:MAG: hypothetical protein BCS36_11145 [Desulfovibrio sp. MES5]|nr:MAG: hypothetical protein BCS36_11145 [Desulfovibrio sp. MES5]
MLGMRAHQITTEMCTRKIYGWSSHGGQLLQPTNYGGFVRRSLQARCGGVQTFMAALSLLLPGIPKH